MFRKHALLAVFAAFSVPLTQPAAGSQAGAGYTIVDISAPLRTDMNATGIALNNSGLVTAVFGNTAFNPQMMGFIYYRGLETFLATLGSGFGGNPINHTPATGVLPAGANDQGFFTGSSNLPSGEQRAFLWVSGFEIDLGTLGGVGSQGIAINNKGHILGTAGLQNGSSDPFLFVNGKMNDLASLAGVGPVGINDQDQIVGNAVDSQENPQAVIWQNNQTTTLNVFGSNYTPASAINNQGAVVGSFYAPQSCAYHAYVWQNGVAADLTPNLGTGGTCGIFATGQATAYAINDRGQILINASGTGSSTGILLFQNNQFIPVNSLIPAGSGWLSLNPTRINNLGQMTGSGCLTSQCVSGQDVTHAFLLTPVGVDVGTATVQSAAGLK